MRRKFARFTPQDFEDFPIWELQEDASVEPYECKMPFEPDPFQAYFVKTLFALADKTTRVGCTMICGQAYEVWSLIPAILTDSGPVELTKLARNPRKKDVEAAYARLGLKPNELFPLRFKTAVPVPKGPARGEMKGFLHRLPYEDENGWSRHHEFWYKSFEELEAAVKKHRKKEVARKGAAEPSEQEKKLLEASKAGKIRAVAELIEKGINLNRGGVIEEDGYTRKRTTPLMLAAENGHVEVALRLLKSGADVHLTEDTNEPQQANRTALACACRKNQVKAARVLLEAGADPNHRLPFGQTLFDDACYEGSIEMIRLLLHFKADPNASCGKSSYFALERAVAADRLDLVKLLLEHHADIEGTDDYAETALIKAAESLRWDIFQFLLEKGADISRCNHSKSTALHRVIWATGRLLENDKKKFAVAIKILEVLVRRGADVNAVTKDGDTPLTLAKNCKFPELTAYLIRNGAKK